MKLNKVYLLCFLLTFLSPFVNAQEKKMDIEKLILQGSFSLADDRIAAMLSDKNSSETDIYDLNFLRDKMQRIRLDFKKTSSDILPYIRKYYRDADEKMLGKFEQDGTLEYMMIDGEKRYFNRAHTNLFLINPEAKQLKASIDGPQPNPREDTLKRHIPAVLSAATDKNTLSEPVNYTLNYTLTVDANAVPEGEVIRCWLPYPREGHQRQRDIKLLGVNDDKYILAGNDVLQRTLYMEKPAEKDKPTVFSMKLSYTAYAQYFGVDAGRVKDYDKTSEFYRQYTSERTPHIVFTDEIKKLSSEIVGNETHPYLKAKLIFTWIDEHIPWAGAREYSTLDNIPMYCLKRRHGDCGIQSLLFITLARLNGIPARWQSGWMLHPGEVNLHDWSEIYLEPYGWVPVDQSFGIQRFGSNEKEKYFYLGGMDAYRLIVNDEFSMPLYPAKVYPRSETVDFQRGEVEWKGGNLYFDKWDYNMDVEYK